MSVKKNFDSWENFNPKVSLDFRFDVLTSTKYMYYFNPISTSIAF